MGGGWSGILSGELSGGLGRFTTKWPLETCHVTAIETESKWWVCTTFTLIMTFNDMNVLFFLIWYFSNNSSSTFVQSVYLHKRYETTTELSGNNWTGSLNDDNSYYGSYCHASWIAVSGSASGNVARSLGKFDGWREDMGWDTRDKSDACANGAKEGNEGTVTECN